jgi:hypothetical protein
MAKDKERSSEDHCWIVLMILDIIEVIGEVLGSAFDD